MSVSNAVVQQRLREFGEFLDAPVDCALEGAVVDLESVARVEQHHLLARVVMPLVQPALERLGLDTRRAPRGRLDRGMVHADDLALDLHQHAAEGLCGRPAFLGLERGEARVGAQFVDEGPHFARRAGEEKVDALGREQDGPHQLAGLRAGQQHGFQGEGVFNGAEEIRGDVEDGKHGRNCRSAGRPAAAPDP